MKKRILAVVLLSVIAVLCAIMFSACEKETNYSTGFEYELINDGKEYKLKGIGDCKDTEIIIPDKYEGKPVTTIGEGAFNGSENLTGVTLGENIKIIEKDAFLNCNSLNKVNYLGLVDEWARISFKNKFSNPVYYAKNLYINDNLLQQANLKTATRIGAYSFENCCSLTDVILGNYVTSIGERAFSSCDSLTNVTLGNRLENVKRYAFYNCSSLKSVVLPNSVKTVGDYAFSDCTYLSNLKIGNNVSKIGKCSFLSCISLTSIELPRSLITISDYAFYNCQKLVEVINNSKLNISVKTSDNGNVGQYVIKDKISEESEIDNKDGYLFYTLNGINYLLGYVGEETELTLPSDYNGQDYEIYKYAFSKNKKITSVTIEGGVRNIGDFAFRDCTSLKNVSIGKVKTIGDSVFSGCNNLQELTIPFVGGTEKVNSDEEYIYPLGYLFGKDSYDGGVRTKQYYSAPNTFVNYSYYYIPSSLKKVTVLSEEIPYGAFYNCSNLHEIVLGDNVKKINDYSFFNSGIKELNIPNEVTEIGYSAFAECCSLETLLLPNKLEEIGDRVFFNCQSLRYNEYDNGLYLGNSENDYFVLIKAKSKKIVGCIINEKCKIIYNSAFANSPKLVSIDIPNSVISIGSGAFYFCHALTYISIGNSVKTIGKGAFWYVGSFNITVPRSVDHIGECAFSECTHLTSMTFEEPDNWFMTNNFEDWHSKSGGIKFDFTDPVATAMYFRKSYCGYSWYKK